MARHRFTYEAGRHIYFDGEECISVNREGNTTPYSADRLTEYIVKLLNGSPAAAAKVGKR